MGALYVLIVAMIAKGLQVIPRSGRDHRVPGHPRHARSQLHGQSQAEGVRFRLGTWQSRILPARARVFMVLFGQTEGFA
jgi:hypothetical protein